MKISNTPPPKKKEILIKHYLRSIVSISADLSTDFSWNLAKKMSWVHLKTYGCHQGLPLQITDNLTQTPLTVPSNLCSALLSQHAVITAFRRWRHVSQKHHRVWAAKHKNWDILKWTDCEKQKRKWTCMETNRPFIHNSGQFLGLKLSV